MIRPSGNRFSCNEGRMCACEITHDRRNEIRTTGIMIWLFSGRQSMSSSVANSVRRDAHAVIAPISTACNASTR